MRPKCFSHSPPSPTTISGKKMVSICILQNTWAVLECVWLDANKQAQHGAYFLAVYSLIRWRPKSSCQLLHLGNFFLALHKATAFLHTTKAMNWDLQKYGKNGWNGFESSVLHAKILNTAGAAMWLRVWGFSHSLGCNLAKNGMWISQKSMSVFQIESPTKMFEELPWTISLFLYCPSNLSHYCLSEGEEKR